jgi:bifunctional oligoribonuclease and PAP phosphatase NrnA
MTDEFNNLQKLVWEKLDNANRVLINIHVNADLDSIGSALGLRSVLKTMGKNVTVFTPEPIAPEKANRAKQLIGFSEILFSDILDLNLTNYDLFVCLDSDNPGRISRNKALTFPLSVPTLVIDHHHENTRFGETNLVIGHGHCTSEILYRLLLEKGLAVTPEVALCFFMGIITDTDRFRFEGPTSADSYKVAGELIEIGNLDFPRIIWELQSKSNAYLQVMGSSLSQAKEYFSGKALLSKLTWADAIKYGQGPEFIKDIYRVTADTMSDSDSAYVSILIYQLGETLWGISIRSNNPNHAEIDSSLIARKFPKGGGHVHGAGAVANGSLEEVEQLVLKNIQECYPDLGQP